MTESFAELFEQSLTGGQSMQPGTIVNAVVLEVKPDVVIVDAGLKSEGVIPIQEFLREGTQETTLPLNVFSCATGPKIFAVNVTKDPGDAMWAAYGGDAMRVEVRPNFGWLNVIIEAFMPKLHAWFDPHDGWAFLGDEAARFYKGPPIMVVKSRTNPVDGAHSAK